MDAALRQRIAERANHCCEYCLIHEKSVGFPHQVDHILSRKHGGPSEPENLAYACVLCNRYKGSDIGSMDRSGMLVRFFHPRRDVWDVHFRIQGPIIEPRTSIGEVTARMLRFNSAERVIERRLLQLLGDYPRFTKR